MSPLHGLRLNCLLAPLVAACVGAGAVLLAWRWQADAIRRGAEEAHLAAIAGLARLAEVDAAPPLEAWLAAHPGWSGVAQIRVRADAVVELGRAGTVPLRREAPPDLILAYQGARSWRHGRAVAYAAPCLPRGGASSVVAAWRDPEPPGPAQPWLLLAGGVLALGGGLGAYLVVRVYRPVEWLQRAAEAATRGAGEPPGAPDGPETASLRSSIATLIAQRRHSGGADDHA